MLKQEVMNNKHLAIWWELQRESVETDMHVKGSPPSCAAGMVDYTGCITEAESRSIPGTLVARYYVQNWSRFRQFSISQFEY